MIRIWLQSRKNRKWGIKYHWFQYYNLYCMCVWIRNRLKDRNEWNFIVAHIVSVPFDLAKGTSYYCTLLIRWCCSCCCWVDALAFVAAIGYGLFTDDDDNNGLGLCFCCFSKSIFHFFLFLRNRFLIN